MNKKISGFRKLASCFQRQKEHGIYLKLSSTFWESQSYHVLRRKKKKKKHIFMNSYHRIVSHSLVISFKGKNILSTCQFFLNARLKFTQISGLLQNHSKRIILQLCFDRLDAHGRKNVKSILLSVEHITLAHFFFFFFVNLCSVLLKMGWS